MDPLLVILCVLLAALIAIVVLMVVPALRRQQVPVATEPVVERVVDESLVEQRVEQQVQERLEVELADQRRQTDALRDQFQQRERELQRAHTDRERELEERGRQAEQLRVEQEAKLAEVQRLRQSAEEHASEERSDLRALRNTLESRERRLAEREERVLAEGRTLEARYEQLTQLRATTDGLRAELEGERGRLRAERDDFDERSHQELQRVAGLDADQARAEVMSRAEHQARLDATALARDIEGRAQREAEGRARRIITTAIQRLASEQTSESVVSTLDLPSDEMKGRIIGREGRNIRHFEQVTGVNVMIDDTPGSVLLSCFDPVRREVARLTLSELVADGRIHPARIEEVHERSRERIEDECLRAAEDALAEVGISDLDPELVPVLGALRYRTSYGQNVLRHLVECANIAGLMAAELGLDVALCKRAAFLHDIGKALTHEVEGSHALVGAELARKHGESPEVVHAIEAHHNEVEPTTVEAVLTQAADAISGSRPGARRESLEAYVHRLDRLEEIASSHPGVERVFAMQAGREVRVMVAPDQVDDLTAHAMAREIAREIQDELTYPGQIRVTVVRESRATEVAH